MQEQAAQIENDEKLLTDARIALTFLRLNFVPSGTRYPFGQETESAVRARLAKDGETEVTK